MDSVVIYFPALKLFKIRSLEKSWEFLGILEELWRIIQELSWQRNRRSLLLHYLSFSVLYMITSPCFRDENESSPLLVQKTDKPGKQMKSGITKMLDICLYYEHIFYVKNRNTRVKTLFCTRNLWKQVPTPELSNLVWVVVYLPGQNFFKNKKSQEDISRIIKKSASRILR